ncbi:MAG: hypothetical protein U9R75_01695, partial [Candidatus Thermoplasmatota archaeon]|nr:hypothetical protein [Candidatus Thermoplasmatota archaeon]
MKRALIAFGALGAVLTLLLTSAVLGNESIATGEDKEQTGSSRYNFFEAWPSNSEENGTNIPTPYFQSEYWANSEDGLSEAEINMDDDPEDNDPYGHLVKRSYHFLTTGFVSQHCDWAKLPQVRSIYTANSSGRWMYNNLPRINATGEARIIDRDGDGVAELVIWKHIIAKDNVLDDTNGSIISRLSGNASVLPVDVNTSVVRNSAFVLIYMDRDGDGTPEIIILSYWNRIRVILSPGNIPIAGYNFNWKGSAYDMDDDGAWNVESFRTSELFKMDMDNDGFDEIIKGHEATYRRIDRAGRPIWDRISATALNKLYIDRNSDGNPEIRSGRTVTGCMVDRNGDLLPELIKIRVTN